MVKGLNLRTLQLFNINVFLRLWWTYKCQGYQFVTNANSSSEWILKQYVKNFYLMCKLCQEEFGLVYIFNGISTPYGLFNTEFDSFIMIKFGLFI